MFVDGVANIGTVAPPTGLFLGTLPSNITTTITFDVIVQGTIPSPNKVVNNANANFTPKINITSVNSQSVTTTINGAFITSTKSNNKSFANIGDIITYNIALLNTGTVTASNILFIDTVPNGTSLIAGTFKQDGNTILVTPNPPGATLPNALGVNKTTTVTFQVKVDTIPNPNPIPNIAFSKFSFTIDPSIPNGGSSSSGTNTVNTQVNNASLSGTVKYVDKFFADCGESINYTIVIPNTGNVTAQNVVFKDTIPTGTILIPDTVFINGNIQLGANPNSGVSVPNISPGNITTITFSVKVIC